MPTEINAQTLPQIKNAVFREYARIYISVYERFMQQIATAGIATGENYIAERMARTQSLKSKGATFRNNEKSIYVNWISPACEACRTGANSVTFYLSLMCHRHCYYCFNPNQEDYGHFSVHKRDCLQELESLHKTGQKITCIALTGGEPLLHPKETADFFRFAREKFRRAHTRLYTSGDLLDQVMLQELKNAQLNEIRFSIKLEDPADIRSQIMECISLAKEYIPSVVVEMPVIPGSLQAMKDLLRDLDHMKITGVNLLEFCFPFHNEQEFNKRSLMIKNPPYQVLYNYWYAGGLPVSCSEIECFNLLEFALDENLKLGLHYCSLENKHIGQIYLQNAGQSASNLTYFSPNDFFLKTAKVFGDDIAPVLQVFKKQKISQYQLNKEHNFLEFHVQEIRYLKSLDLEVGLSFSIMEDREDGRYLRELKIELVSPQTFDIRKI